MLIRNKTVSQHRWFSFKFISHLSFSSCKIPKDNPQPPTVLFSKLQQWLNGIIKISLYTQTNPRYNLTWIFSLFTCTSAYLLTKMILLLWFFCCVPIGLKEPISIMFIWNLFYLISTITCPQSETENKLTLVEMLKDSTDKKKNRPVWWNL